MGLRVYGEGKTQGPRIDRIYTDIKIANNNKINHIMVSITDHYNAMSIDRLPSKTEIGKDSWKRFMKIVLLCQPEFSSATKTSFLLKTQKNNHSSARYRWEYHKYCFKEKARTFSKSSTTQEIGIPKPKKRMKFVQKENFDRKIKPVIEKLCTQLHAPPPSSLQHPQLYENQNIAHNLAVFQNLGRKIQSWLF